MNQSFHTQSGPFGVRDAATVLVLRSRPAQASRERADAGDIEVLMMRRAMTASFLPGAYVFPGGVVDAADAAIAHGPHVHGHSDTEACQLLGLPQSGLAFWVAAVRECFEEAGLFVGADLVMSPSVQDRLHQHRTRLLDGTCDFADILASESISIATDRLIPWSRWITPTREVPGSGRRFDTRFFVTQATNDEIGSHDEREMSDLRWFRPTEALLDPDVVLITPTISALRLLERSGTVHAALAAAGQRARSCAPVPEGRFIAG
jgi:8-oxo-dGTP pyrophosphatase MutT (NUDIX family)